MDPSLQLLMLAIGLACYAYATRRRWWPHLATLQGAQLADGVRTYAARAVARLRAPAAAEGGALVAQGKVAAAAWLNVLNDQPDRYPHLIIVGPTGAGKTTFTMALLSARPGRVAVLTPKPDPADWPGVPIVTIDDDGHFADLTQAFEALGAELRRRLVATKQQQPVGAPLTIVCDDWPVLAAECGRPATDLFKLVGRLGRSLRVRLVVLSQSERVKSLGLDGEGDAVANFARVDLGRGHTATLAVDGLALPLDTSWVPSMARRRTDPARWWHSGSAERAIGDVERLLDQALGGAGSQRPTTGVAGAATPNCEDGADCSQQQQQRPEAAESPTPGVVVGFDGVDWGTVARLVNVGAIGETAALKSLGYTPGSTNQRYQAARAALRKAMGKE